MPVWHEAAKPFVERGELQILGLVQEQHPDRAELYAQWRGFDFPILWDPFNLTRSKAVPIVFGVDANGNVVKRMDVRRAEEELRSLIAMEPAESRERRDPWPGLGPEQGPEGARPFERALSESLSSGSPPTDRAMAAFQAAAGDSAHSLFQWGVALRLRHDSPARQPGDFQASLDAWLGALMQDPGQYIWRRRIQQWGPRLDKPYSFYDWVDQARADLLARGEEPRAVYVPLSGSERANGTQEIPLAEGQPVHPDPNGKVPVDEGKSVEVSTAIALHTGVADSRVREPFGTARVHVWLRPVGEAKFEPEGGELELWIEVPKGWNVKHQRLTAKLHPSGVASFDFEVRPPAPVLGPPGEGPPPDPGPPEVHLRAFYPVCLGESGECTYLSQPHVLTFPSPPPRGGDSDED